MPAGHCLVFCTCPDNETALELATAVVTAKLVACVNVLPRMTSVYAWEGRVESAEEHMLLMKTHTALFEELELFIRHRHPYNVPEIITVPIAQGSGDYLSWISSWVGNQL